MGKIRDLKLSSQNKLRQFSNYWECTPTNDPKFLDRDLDNAIDVILTGVGPLAGHFLHYAILCDDKDLVQDLCKHGAGVNKFDEQWTNAAPLQLATDYGRSSIVKLLLEQGANLDGVKMNYAMTFTQPLTFMWGMMERVQGRTVDYNKVTEVLNTYENKQSHEFRPNLKFKNSPV